MEVLTEVNLVMILLTRFEVSVSFLRKAKTNSSSLITPSWKEQNEIKNLIKDPVYCDMYCIIQYNSIQYDMTYDFTLSESIFDMSFSVSYNKNGCGVNF